MTPRSVLCLAGLCISCGGSTSPYEGFYLGDVTNRSSEAPTSTAVGVIVQVATGGTSNEVFLISDTLSRDVLATVSGSALSFPPQGLSTTVSGSAQVFNHQITGGSGQFAGRTLSFTVTQQDSSSFDGGAPTGGTQTDVTFSGSKQ